VDGNFKTGQRAKAVGKDGRKLQVNVRVRTCVGKERERERENHLTPFHNISPSSRLPVCVPAVKLAIPGQVLRCNPCRVGLDFSCVGDHSIFCHENARPVRITAIRTVLVLHTKQDLAGFSSGVGCKNIPLRVGSRRQYVYRHASPMGTVPFRIFNASIT